MVSPPTRPTSESCKLLLTWAARFYVNTHTKESTWTKPTEPAPDPTSSHEAPPGPPPSYADVGNSSSTNNPLPSEKHNPNNPYNAPTATASSSVDEDAKLAARLQAEEDARASSSAGNRGANAEFFDPNANFAHGHGGSQQQQQQQTGSSFSQELPPRDPKSKGVMGKLFGKMGGHSPTPPQYAHGGPPPPGGYGYQGGPPQGGGYGYGPPPQQGYGYGPPQGYGYAAQPGYAYAGPPPQQQQYMQAPPAKSSGLSPFGGAALGVGGGLVGGMLLSEVMENHDNNEYQQGYDQGQQNADYGDGGMQGDYGDNGDMGGDMGGDF